MKVTTMSIRAFDQDTGRARRAAAHGAVFITDRGNPAHELLGIEEYQRITDVRRDIATPVSFDAADRAASARLAPRRGWG